MKWRAYSTAPRPPSLLEIMTINNQSVPLIPHDSSFNTIPSDLLDIPEAARKLGVGKTAVYSLITRGDIAHHRVGRRIRLRELDIAAYLSSSRVEARPHRPYGCYPPA